jgi:hypothetical protein
MLELIRYLRANGFRTCIVTGGGPGVRARLQATRSMASRSSAWWAPASSPDTQAENGKPVAGGRDQPLHRQAAYAAFGNSEGDREMLEVDHGRAPASGSACWSCMTTSCARMPTGPARGLPDTKSGTFAPALADRAKQKGWVRDPHEQRLQQRVRAALKGEGLGGWGRRPCAVERRPFAWRTRILRASPA